MQTSERRGLGQVIGTAIAIAVSAPAASAVAAIPPPPPPPPVAVLTVSSDVDARGYAEAYVALIAHDGAFNREPAEISPAVLHGCTLGGQDTAACVRTILQARTKDVATAAVLVTKSDDGRQSWTCIGTGAEPFQADRQQVELDMKTAFFGDTDAKFEQYKRASGCITAAAAESGW